MDFGLELDPRMEQLETIIESIGESKKISDWIRWTRLGRGNSGTVYIGINTANDHLFAVKSAKQSDTQNRLDLWKERGVLNSCQSPYIVEYFGHGTSRAKRETEKTKYLDVYMEYVEAGSVRNSIWENAGSLEEPIVAAYTRDVLRGLDYLHREKDIVHGDIKCANFLIGRECIKLCDFSQSKFMEKGDIVVTPRPGEAKKRRIHVTGTEGFMAPEVEGSTMQDQKSDIYSLGCSIVEMLTGAPPGKDPIIYSSEDYSKISVDVPPDFSPEGTEFVSMCMKHFPEDRPDAHELLLDPWIVTAPSFPRAIELPSPKILSPKWSPYRFGWAC